jgi:hypothetical protein
MVEKGLINDKKICTVELGEYLQSLKDGLILKPYQYKKSQKATMTISEVERILLKCLRHGSCTTTKPTQYQVPERREFDIDIPELVGK